MKATLREREKCKRKEAIAKARKSKQEMLSDLEQMREVESFVNEDSGSGEASGDSYEQGDNQENDKEEDDDEEDRTEGGNEAHSLTMSDELIDDEEIWSLAKIDRVKFYAAALVHDCVDSQRSWSWPYAHAKGSCALESQFLDQLALLFARAKKLNLKDTERDNYPCPSSTGQNVTATSLWTSPDDRRIIYVAKNDGAQRIDNTGDEEFGNKIADWLSSLDSRAKPQMANNGEMWRNLQDFWFHRHRFYVHEIKAIQKCWMNLKITITETSTEQKKTEDTVRTLSQRHHNQTVHELDSGAEGRQTDIDERQRKVTITKGRAKRRKGHGKSKSSRHENPKIIDGIDLRIDEPFEAFTDALGTHGHEVELFKKDWAHAKKLISWLDDVKYSVIDDKDCLRTYVDRICFEDDGIWNLSYKKHRTSTQQLNLETLEDDFRKLVKYFKMLRTMLVFWNTCTAFREFMYKPVEIRFLPKRNVRTISRQELLQCIESWKENDISDTSREKLEATQIRLKNMKSLYRNFHCELQLLQIRPENLNEDSNEWNRGHYFGCSKLSCLLCWKLLRGQHFSTKNTHGKLEQGCAFPLQILRDECSRNFVTRLQQIANSVILDVESVRCYDVQNNKERKARSETTTALQSFVDAPYSCYQGWDERTFPSSTVKSDSDLFSKFARGTNLDFEQDESDTEGYKDDVAELRDTSMVRHLVPEDGGLLSAGYQRYFIPGKTYESPRGLIYRT